MTKTTDHKGRTALLAYQFNLRLKIEGLGVKARKDREVLSREAKAETAERRRLIEMRRRPGYATVEAQKPFAPEVRLIRAKDRPETTGTKEEDTGPARRPSFEEMHAQTTAYPGIPAEVREHERRKREQRRTKARVQKRAERDCRKK